MIDAVNFMTGKDHFQGYAEVSLTNPRHISVSAVDVDTHSSIKFRILTSKIDLTFSAQMIRMFDGVQFHAEFLEIFNDHHD